MKTATPFLAYAQNRCEAAGVELCLLPRQFTRDGDLGVFDDEKKRITVCVRNTEWLTTLAHELGHLDQWSANSDVWRAAMKAKVAEDAYEDFDLWLSGRTAFSTREIRGVVRRIQRCELDAERRALRLIRTFGLDDPKAYARVANFHVWQYEAARRLGIWVEASPALTAAMPDRLMRVAAVGDLPVGFGFG